MKFVHVKTRQEIDIEKDDKMYEIISTSPSWQKVGAEKPESK